MLKVDVAKLGRNYLAVLWLSIAGLTMGMVGKIFLLDSNEPWVRAERDSIAVLLIAAFLHGAAAWGVIQRWRWGYYLSLAISLYLVLVSAYGFVVPGGSVYRWPYVLFFVPGAIALSWLVSPGARSQFSASQKA